jgi:hypothetical protein
MLSLKLLTEHFSYSAVCLANVSIMNIIKIVII